MSTPVGGIWRLLSPGSAHIWSERRQAQGGETVWAVHPRARGPRKRTNPMAFPEECAVVTRGHPEEPGCPGLPPSADTHGGRGGGKSEQPPGACGGGTGGQWRAQPCQGPRARGQGAAAGRSALTLCPPGPAHRGRSLWPLLAGGARHPAGPPHEAREQRPLRQAWSAGAWGSR